MNTRVRYLGVAAAVALTVAACGGSDKDNSFTITVTNNTKGQPITPALAVAHNDGFSLFTVGQPASPGITLQAEDGDSSVARQEARDNGAVSLATGDNIVLPGKSATFDFEFNGDATSLTLTTMLATTNDGFAAVSNVALPASGSATYQATVYDAGTEENTESCDHIPGPPCSAHGARTDTGEGTVELHGGITGGADLDPATHGWTDPAVTVTISRK